MCVNDRMFAINTSMVLFLLLFSRVLQRISWDAIEKDSRVMNKKCAKAQIIVHEAKIN